MNCTAAHRVSRVLAHVQGVEGTWVAGLARLNLAPAQLGQVTSPPGARRHGGQARTWVLFELVARFLSELTDDECRLIEESLQVIECCQAGVLGRLAMDIQRRCVSSDGVRPIRSSAASTSTSSRVECSRPACQVVSESRR